MWYGIFEVGFFKSLSKIPSDDVINFEHITQFYGNILT